MKFTPAAVVLAFAICCAGPAMAFNASGQRWVNSTTVFSVDIPGANGLWNRAFDEAMDEWTNATRFTFANNPSAQDPCANSSLNGVAFSTTVCGSAWGSTTLGITLLTWDADDLFISTDILFNANKPWGVYSGPWMGPGAQGVNEFRRVAVHELGHALGLNHEDRVSAVMNSLVSDTERPTSDDIAGVNFMYPQAPSPTPSNDDFADRRTISGTSISVTGNNASATRENGEPNPTGGSGGRSVWWAWRAPAAGQVVLDTRGSDFDTTLGVYTGSSLGTLRLVGENDDISVGNVVASRLRFNAVSDQRYAILVNGWNGATGNISLNLDLSVNDEPVAMSGIFLILLE